MRVGIVGASGLGAGLHGVNENLSFGETMRNVGISMGTSAALQLAFLGLDARTGKLSSSVLDARILDGAKQTMRKITSFIVGSSILEVEGEWGGASSMKFLKFLLRCLLEALGSLDIGANMTSWIKVFIGFIVLIIPVAIFFTAFFFLEWMYALSIAIGFIVAFCLVSILIELIFFRKKFRKKHDFTTGDTRWSKFVEHFMKTEYFNLPFNYKDVDYIIVKNGDTCKLLFSEGEEIFKPARNLLTEAKLHDEKLEDAWPFVRWT